MCTLGWVFPPMPTALAANQTPAQGVQLGEAKPEHLGNVFLPLGAPAFTAQCHGWHSLCPAASWVSLPLGSSWSKGARGLHLIKV